MKTIITSLFLALLLARLAWAAPENPALTCSLAITPEIKKAFQSGDTVEIREITGTSNHFEVGGIYRIRGVCRQHSLHEAMLYIGNTAESGTDAIVPLPGSTLFKAVTDGSTEFDCTFELLRPGILHATIYNTGDHRPDDNAWAGIYLGDVVVRH